MKNKKKKAWGDLEKQKYLDKIFKKLQAIEDLVEIIARQIARQISRESGSHRASVLYGKPKLDRRAGPVG